MPMRIILAVVFAVAGAICWLLPAEIGGLLSHALPVQLPRKRYHRLAIFRCGRHPMVRPTLMWFLFQSTIIFAVVASNIHRQWTPNGYLPAILGAGLAWLLTRLLNVRWRGRNDI
jgi:hypothetical protein